MREERTGFTSDGLALEAMLQRRQSSLAAVVMHPHPQYGGDMHNPVVTSLCRTLADGAGATTLRFNFRGTGGSKGSFDGGRGESRDAVAAAEYLREVQPSAELLLAGYSFGALVAAAAAADIQPMKLILVSPPGLEPQHLSEDIPTLVVSGGADQVARPEALLALESPVRRVVIVPEADHFWLPGGDALDSTVRDYLADRTD